MSNIFLFVRDFFYLVFGDVHNLYKPFDVLIINIVTKILLLPIQLCFISEW